MRFTRAHFGQYEFIDFAVVLIGYVVSGEPTLLAFYERLAPWASPFMALFGRDRLPHRSTLSRFLAALDQATLEALRTLFQKDLLARKPFPSPGGLFDRRGANLGHFFSFFLDTLPFGEPFRRGERLSSRVRVRLPLADLDKEEDIFGE